MAHTPRYAYQLRFERRMQWITQINVTAALYIWLYSRAFALGNKIGISQVKLAGILGVHQRTIRSSVKRLKDKGLIRVKTNKSREGGSEFSLNRVPALKKWISENASHKNKNGSRIKRDFLEPIQTVSDPHYYSANRAPSPYVSEDHSALCDRVELPYNINNEYIP